MSSKILVIGNSNSLGQKIVASLRDRGNDIFVLDSHPGEGLNKLPVNLAVESTLSQEALSQVQQVVIAMEADFNTPENFGNTGFTFTQLENLLYRGDYLALTSSLVLFDFRFFSSGQLQQWGAVNDGVMGGVSQSQLEILPDRALFAGNVSTQNNGGFASVRTKNYEPPLDLSSYEGIALKVKGDGKRYKFICRCEGTWDGVSYSTSFDTVYNVLTEVKIPFAQLRPVLRAKTFPEAGSFDASRVYALQLMLSKFEYDGELNNTFEPGAFELAVESISAYGGAAKPSFVVVNAGENDTLERKLYSSELNYTLVRDRALDGLGATMVFNSSHHDLVSVALKAMDSSEAIRQFWLLLKAKNS